MAGAYGGTPGTPAPKVVTGGNGDAVAPLTNGVGAKGFIGWTPDPTNASVNGGNSNASVANPSGVGNIGGSGASQSQPVNTATI